MFALFVKEHNFAKHIKDLLEQQWNCILDLYPFPLKPLHCKKKNW